MPPQRAYPGIFGEQVIRLRRERWRSINEFAEEMFALLNYGGPLRVGNPVTFVQTGEESPVTVVNADGDTVFNFGDDGADFGDFPPFTELPPAESPDDPDEPDTPTSATFPGIIVSGSGDTYQVSIFEHGHTQPPTQTVTVKQLQIATSWTIPAGTACHVVANVVPAQGATTPATLTYSILVPIWLQRPS